MNDIDIIVHVLKRQAEIIDIQKLMIENLRLQINILNNKIDICYEALEEKE